MFRKRSTQSPFPKSLTRYEILLLASLLILAALTSGFWMCRIFSREPIVFERTPVEKTLPAL